MRSRPWTLLVPLKPLPAAKGRLRGALPGLPHDDLVVAVASATVSAALAADGVGRLIVVTDDGYAGQRLRRLGAELLPDGVNDLNAALATAAASVAGPVAAMPADLPALLPVELAQALGQAALLGRRARAFVADADGTGTVLLTAGQRARLAPRFGIGSAAAHERHGARRLDGSWPTLRRDVDTADDLRQAQLLGWRPPSIAGLAYRLAGMQGTVATFDAESRTGSLLLDDGTPVSFDRAAFDTSGLRLLRIGQRVRLEYDAQGRLEKITIPTLP